MLRLMSWVVIGLLGMALLDGCGNTQKEATEAAINAAQAAINATQAEAEKYVPEQLHAAQATIQKAREALAKSDYQSALTLAQNAANKAKELATAAAAKRDELMKDWTSLSECLPKSMDAVKAKLEAYSRGAHMPEGMDKEKLAQAKERFAQFKQDWADASAKALQGNFGEAKKKADELQDALAKLMESLGIKLKENE